MLSASQFCANGGFRVIAKMLLGLGLLLAGPGLACSPIEVEPCAPVIPPEDTLLAPFRAQCAGVFAIEEFAVTQDDTGAWRLNLREMACDDVPLCTGDTCAVIRATPCPTAGCWHYDKGRAEVSPAAPQISRPKP